MLISTAGTTGEVGLVTKDILPANIDQDVARIHVLDSEKLNPYYLTAFLNSKYGQFQFTRGTTGQIQTHISLDKLKNVTFIPVPNWQNKVSVLVKEAVRYFDGSKTNFLQAEKLLLEELGMADYRFDNELSNVVNFSEVKIAERMDAEYFQQKYEKLLEKIKNYGCKKLDEVLENVEAKFNPKLDENYKYVELSNINASIGVIDGFSEVLGKEAPSRAKRVLKVGDVIVSSVEGSLGKVALIAKEQQGFLASTGFFQFRSKEVLPEVLLILAKSIVFKMQLEKFCAGTILTAVPKEAVKNLQIPILPKAVQERIVELVKQSHEARKKARELLEEAKTKVEELIEKGSE